MKKLYFIIFTATLVCQARAAQEAPLMLQIKDIASSSLSIEDVHCVPVSEACLPSSGHNRKIDKYVKQNDNTYRLFMYSRNDKKWLQADQTPYRFEEVPNENPCGAAKPVFVSTTTGPATPVYFNDKQIGYAVDLLPEIYIDCSQDRKWERQSDGTYRCFKWRQEPRRWVEYSDGKRLEGSRKKGKWVRNNTEIWTARRICDLNGYLRRTKFEYTVDDDVPGQDNAPVEEYKNQD